jgi:hypothetical protein
MKLNFTCPSIGYNIFFNLKSFDFLFEFSNILIFSFKEAFDNLL